MKKKIGFAILILFVIAQFIQPKKNIANNGEQHLEEIKTQLNLPSDVHKSFKVACYDCHSNQTNYPWYNRITPLNFWLSNHIKEGKEHFNFSTLLDYDAKKRDHKLEELIEEIEEDKMPLKAYSYIHPKANLSDVEKQQIIDWATKMRASIQ